MDYSGGDGQNIWSPDKALRRNDGDTSLMFLSANNIVYLGEPVKDPIYQANLTTGNNSESGKQSNVFTSNYYVNPLGCVDQHQFCNPTTQACTKLDSYYTAVKSAQADLNLTAMQYGVVSTLSIDLYFSIISQSKFDQYALNGTRN